MTDMIARRFVLDLPVDPLTLNAAVDRVAQVMQSHRASPDLTPLQIVTLNAEMAMQALQDEELAAVIRHCGLVVPDGSGVVWALRRHGDVVQKVAGVDLVRAMAARAAQDGYSVYFLGGKPGVAQEAADKLAEQFPGLRVAGCRDGYFQPADEPALLDEIRTARPDLLLVALGVPRQEKWIVQHQKALGVPVAMGVGGSFDVFAGRVKRAPVGFQRLHIEWLYRLIQEPWRFQRMQSTLPAFVGEVLKRG
ncbi:MAG: glycosyl transferase, WecB/TagA/CpsF family [Cyanobacteria bacterium RYN_339]|nr:glycosyl transferase, WecB/TagA/CpsF family [Cyanobacteria bacterium RYN_339]